MNTTQLRFYAKYFLRGVIIGAILCTLLALILINTGQRRVMNSQSERLDELRNRYDSITIEYLIYKAGDGKAN